MYVQLQYLLQACDLLFSVYFDSTSSSSVPHTPAPTPTNSFIPDAPIMFDLVTVAEENGGVVSSLAGPPKFVLHYYLLHYYLYYIIAPSFLMSQSYSTWSLSRRKTEE